MFPRAAAWSVTVQPIPGLEDGAPEFGRYRTRVRGAKEVLGQVPVSCLAEEIATPGEGQIKALITVAGNPVLSTPAGHKLDEVLPTLDAMISVDLWLNETTRHADVILPGAVAARAAAPRRPDPQLRDQQHRELLGAGVRRPRTRTGPEEWEILIRLTGLCTGTPAEDVDVAAIDDGFFDYMAFTQGLDGADHPQALRPRRARAHPRLHPAHRTVRRPLRREPRRRHAGEAQGPAERHQLRADGAAGARGARHRRTARSGWPRSTCSTTCPGSPSASTAHPTSSCWSAGAICGRTTRGCTTSDR